MHVRRRRDATQSLLATLPVRRRTPATCSKSRPWMASHLLAHAQIGSEEVLHIFLEFTTFCKSASYAYALVVRRQAHFAVNINNPRPNTLHGSNVGESDVDEMQVASRTRPAKAMRVEFLLGLEARLASVLRVRYISSMCVSVKAQRAHGRPAVHFY